MGPVVFFHTIYFTKNPRVCVSLCIGMISGSDDIILIMVYKGLRYISWNYHIYTHIEKMSHPAILADV